MDQFTELINHILDNGVKKMDRTGVGTISTFGYQCRFDMSEGFPIVTTKKTAFKAAQTELIWMIGGWRKENRYEGLQMTNIKFLIDNGVKIWTEWPYKRFKEATGSDISQAQYEEKIKEDKDFAIQWGDLGPVYQKQWRYFEGKKMAADQLLDMIGMLKRSPDSRRMLTSFWNPTEVNDCLLPPCHLLHQVWTRDLSEAEKAFLAHDFSKGNTATSGMNYNDIITHFNLPTKSISLQMYQRSSDCFLGVPFDWVFYGLLAHMLAEICNMVVGDFIWVSGDTHLYLNQIEGAKAVVKRKPHPYPKLKINRKVDNIEDYVIGDFELVDYKFHDAIKVAVAV